jgi:hypothetical protein
MDWLHAELPDFSCTMYQNGDNIAHCNNIYQNNANGHKVYQMVTKEINFYIQRPLKMYQNWGFGLKLNRLATLGCRCRTWG